MLSLVLALALPARAPDAATTPRRSQEVEYHEFQLPKWCDGEDSVEPCGYACAAAVWRAWRELQSPLLLEGREAEALCETPSEEDLRLCLANYGCQKCLNLISCPVDTCNFPANSPVENRTFDRCYTEDPKEGNPRPCCFAELTIEVNYTEPTVYQSLEKDFSRIETLLEKGETYEYTAEEKELLMQQEVIIDRLGDIDDVDEMFERMQIRYPHPDDFLQAAVAAQSGVATQPGVPRGIPYGIGWQLTSENGISCEEHCGMKGLACVQSELDRLQASYDDDTQKAFALALGRKCRGFRKLCENTQYRNRSSDCLDHGSPYMRIRDASARICSGGKPIAPCDAVPQVRGIARLCPCGPPRSGFSMLEDLKCVDADLRLRSTRVAYTEKNVTDESECVLRCAAQDQCIAATLGPPAATASPSSAPTGAPTGVPTPEPTPVPTPPIPTPIPTPAPPSPAPTALPTDLVRRRRTKTKKTDAPTPGPTPAPTLPSRVCLLYKDCAVMDDVPGAVTFFKNRFVESGQLAWTRQDSELWEDSLGLALRREKRLGRGILNVAAEGVGRAVGIAVRNTTRMECHICYPGERPKPRDPTVRTWTCQTPIECQNPNWNFLRLQLYIAFAIWLFVSVIGFNLAYMKRRYERRKGKNPLYNWKMIFTKWTGMIQANCRTLFLLIPVYQATVYCYRDSVHRVNTEATFFELFLAFLLLMDSIIQTLAMYLTHMESGFKASLSTLPINCLAFMGPLGVLIPMANGAKSWWSFSWASAGRILQRKTLARASPTQQKTDVAIITMATFFVAAVAFITIEDMEDDERPLDFLGPDMRFALEGDAKHTWSVGAAIYFMLVTISTVGYGDMSPVTIFGKAWLSVFIIFSISGFTFVTSELLELYRMHTMGRGAYMGSTRRLRHVVVVGRPSAATISELVREFYHPDHSLRSDLSDLPDLVILHPNAKGIKTLQAWLSSRKTVAFQHKVLVLRGNVFERDFGDRTKAGTAGAFFVLPSLGGSLPPDVEDTQSVLRLMAVKAAAAEHKKPGDREVARMVCLLCMEEAKPLVQSMSTVLCLETIRLTMLGKSVVVPGYSSFISSLFKSIGDQDMGPEAPIWMENYVKGLGMELYEIELSSGYDGMTFAEVCQDVLYRSNAAVNPEESEGDVYLIGLVQVHSQYEERKVMLHPGKRYRLDPQFNSIGVFLAPNKESVVQKFGFRSKQKRDTKKKVERDRLRLPKEAPGGLSVYASDHPLGRTLNPRMVQEMNLSPRAMLRTATLDNAGKKAVKLPDLVEAPVWSAPTGTEVRAQGQTIRKAGVARGELLAIARVLMSGLLNLNQIRQLRREVRDADADEEMLIRFTYDRFYGLKRNLTRLVTNATTASKRKQSQADEDPNSPNKEGEEEPQAQNSLILSFDQLSQMRWALDIANGLLERLAMDVGMGVPADIVNEKEEFITLAEDLEQVDELRNLTSTILKQRTLADKERAQMKILERGCSAAFSNPEKYDKTTSRVADLINERMAANERMGGEVVVKQIKKAKAVATGSPAETFIERYKMAENPTPPPTRLLARGGHILFCVLGDPTDPQMVGFPKFLQPIRDSMIEFAVPLVVLSEVRPADWYRVVDQEEVYFLKGSPLSSFDLERAGVRVAGMILVYSDPRSGKGVKEVQMLDAEAIFATRVVENFKELVSKQVFVVLKNDENVAFAPLLPGTVPKKRKAQISVVDEINQLRETKETAKEALKSRLKMKAIKRKKQKKTWFAKLQKFLMSFIVGGDFFGKTAGGEIGDTVQADEGNFTKQPRYAMGHCFISSTITFLVAGTYYNPTIPQLLDLFTLKDFMMVSVTNLWIGKTYGHIFRHLLEEKDMLAVAIYRKTTSDDAECTHPAGVEGAPPPGYIFTAPPANEILCRFDKLLCMLKD